MEKGIEALADHIRNKRYHKIVQTLTYIKRHNVEFDNTAFREAFHEQEGILKMIVANDVQISLCGKKEMLREVLEVVVLLDSAFQEHVRKVAVDAVVRLSGGEFRSRCRGLGCLGDLHGHFKWFETRVAEAEAVYACLPDAWSLVTTLVLVFCGETSRVMQEKQMVSLASDKSIVDAIKECVTFEIRHTRNIICRCPDGTTHEEKGKDASILFSGADVETHGEESPAAQDIPGVILRGGECLCNNKRCMSSLFSEKLDAYVRHLCVELGEIDFDQGDSEMYIIRCFIRFFGIVAKTYTKMTYFAEKAFLGALCAKCDEHLCRYLDKIEVDDNYAKMVVATNTVLFITQTLYDFLTQKAQVSYEEAAKWRCAEKLRALEKRLLGSVGKRVEHLVTHRCTDMADTFSTSFLQTLRREVLAFNVAQIYPGLTDFVFESAFSVLLLKISRLKMNVPRAEHILSEVGEIRSSLADTKSRIPVLCTIETYLKIYLVPPTDTENFVNNFILVSDGKFAFGQILRKLENTGNNARLYLYYRSQTKAAVQG